MDCTLEKRSRRNVNCNPIQKYNDKSADFSVIVYPRMDDILFYDWYKNFNKNDSLMRQKYATAPNSKSDNFLAAYSSFVLTDNGWIRETLIESHSIRIRSLLYRKAFVVDSLVSYCKWGIKKSVLRWSFKLFWLTGLNCRNVLQIILGFSPQQ